MTYRYIAVLAGYLALLAGCNPPQAGEQQGVASRRSASNPEKLGSAETNWMADYVKLRVYAANARYNNDLKYSARIVGGVPAAPNDNPFQVALLNKSMSGNYDSQFCGGALIAPNIVVTAAHCSDFVTASQVQVLTGARALDTTGTKRNVVNISIHPSWNGSTMDYDVAVWKLDTPATGPFAKLASAENDLVAGLDGREFLITGWGTQSEGGSKPIPLYKTEVPLADRSDCNDANSYNGSITGRMICAGRLGGGKDTCQGDSGGPMTLENTLYGITSWGRGCARPNFYGVYTRISNSEVAAFIAANR